MPRGRGQRPPAAPASRGHAERGRRDAAGAEASHLKVGAGAEASHLTVGPAWPHLARRRRAQIMSLRSLSLPSLSLPSQGRVLSRCLPCLCQVLSVDHE